MTAPDRRIGTRIARAALQVRGDGPLAVLDLVIVVVTYTLLYALRFDFSVPDRYLDVFKDFLPVACAIHLISTWAWGGYGRTWRYASIDEARRLLCAGATAGVALFALFAWGDGHVPYSVLLAGPIVVTFLFGMVRFQSRLFAVRRFGDRKNGVRVAVVGAGTTGSAALRELQRESTARSRPGGGGRRQPVVARATDPRRADRGRHRRSRGDRPRPRRQPVALRDPVCTTGSARASRRRPPKTPGSRCACSAPPSSWVHSHAAAPRVCATFGSKTSSAAFRCRSTSSPCASCSAASGCSSPAAAVGSAPRSPGRSRSFAPATLVLLDHDETHLHDSMQSLGGVRRARVVPTSATPPWSTRVFAPRPPRDRVPRRCAQARADPRGHACEAILTNIAGTANVVDACVRAGSTHLVCISTDKAATPSSVMGSVEVGRRADRAGARAGGRHLLLRPIRQRARESRQRDPHVPAPDPRRAGRSPSPIRRMTRYFMSTDEAVRLVLSAAAVERGDRHVLALEMGDQVNIYELAERMIRLSGYEPGVDITIEITGLLPGENLTEQMVGSAERREADADGPIVSIAPVPLPRAELEGFLERLETLAIAGDHVAARAALLEFPAGALTVDAHGVVTEERRRSLKTRS